MTLHAIAIAIIGIGEIAIVISPISREASIAIVIDALHDRDCDLAIEIGEIVIAISPIAIAILPIEIAPIAIAIAISPIEIAPIAISARSMIFSGFYLSF